MKLLDLFCGAGGAAYGYYLAGFTDIVGVDIKPQPNYPFKFIQADALQIELENYDAIHASPPCQRWSSASGRPSEIRIEQYTDLLRPIREKLKKTNIPYIIENVEGAPLKDPIKLCGTIFPKLRVLRHRLFECNFYVEQPKLDCGNHPLLFHNNGGDPYTGFVTVAGGGKCPIGAARSAMGISWMNQKELSDAIPPSYTEYIGGYLLEKIRQKNKN